MSCGTPPVYDAYFEDTFPGHLAYKRHPRHCYYTENGTTAALVNLVDIHWRGWGQRRAFARAKRVDNHDMDRNGFQRHPVRIILSYRQGAVGHTGSRKLYYTRMRIFDQGRTGVLHLFRPGQPPVQLSARRVDESANRAGKRLGRHRCGRIDGSPLVAFNLRCGAAISIWRRASSGSLPTGWSGENVDVAGGEALLFRTRDSVLVSEAQTPHGLSLRKLHGAPVVLARVPYGE